MSITEKQCEEVDVNHVRHTDEPEGTNQKFVRVLSQWKCTAEASPAETRC